jgi:hypothetical protein
MDGTCGPVIDSMDPIIMKSLLEPLSILPQVMEQPRDTGFPFKAQRPGKTGGQFRDSA